MQNGLPSKHVALGTISFTVCFVVWGMISAFAPRFRDLFHLSATETAFLVAIPVVLGSIGRLPVGMLADRFGGRRVFVGVMILAAIPALWIPAAHTYLQLVLLGLWLGMAGTSFAVGVGYVSRWAPPARQGTTPAAGGRSPLRRVSIIARPDGHHLRARKRELPWKARHHTPSTWRHATARWSSSTSRRSLTRARTPGTTRRSVG